MLLDLRLYRWYIFFSAHKSLAGDSIMKIEKLSIFCALALASVLQVSRPTPVSAQNQTIQVVELTAKKYEYSSPVHVKAGTKIQLKITALDHDHGFKISPIPDGAAAGCKPGLLFTSPEDCWEIGKGKTMVIEFVAQTPGTYSFKCCHLCGLGHRGMKSQIIVE